MNRLDRIRDVRDGSEGQPDQATKSEDHEPLVPYSHALQSADCLVIHKPYGCVISRQEFGKMNFLLNTWLDEIPS
jgi:hypothetical protein